MGKFRKTRDHLGKALASPRSGGGGDNNRVNTGGTSFGRKCRGSGAEGAEGSWAPPEHWASPRHVHVCEPHLCLWGQDAARTHAPAEASPRSSFPLERKIFKRNTLQTAEISPLLAPFSYLSERFSEAVCRLPHEMVIPSTSNSSPQPSSNVSSLILSPSREVSHVPHLSDREARGWAAGKPGQFLQ